MVGSSDVVKSPLVKSLVVSHSMVMRVYSYLVMLANTCWYSQPQIKNSLRERSTSKQRTHFPIRVHS